MTGVQTCALPICDPEDVGPDVGRDPTPHAVEHEEVGVAHVVGEVGEVGGHDPGVLQPAGRDLLRGVRRVDGVDVDADELAAIGQRLFEHFKRLVFGQVPQEAQDQFGADAEFAARTTAGAREAADHRMEGHAALGVRLRIEKDLGDLLWKITSNALDILKSRIGSDYDQLRIDSGLVHYSCSNFVKLLENDNYD